MKEKPFFNEKGDLYIPKSIKFGGEMSPKLKPREWFAYILTISKNTKQKHWDDLIGCKSTQRRMKHILKEKGYVK